jgi:hypothetical protein
MILRVAKVEHLGPYRLRLEFTDGADFAPECLSRIGSNKVP